jgi:hypothetical protein
MQCGGSDATSGRQRHDNTHHMASCAAIPVVTQPPYSPDLAPSDFWLFPTLKIGLKGTRFATTVHIKSKAAT